MRSRLLVWQRRLQRHWPVVCVMILCLVLLKSLYPEVAGRAGVTFIVVSDWGAPAERPEMVATQRLVARAMQAVVTKVTRRLDFVVNGGDTFYLNGIRNVSDPRLTSVFASTFQEAPRLAKVDWLSVLGNHDCRGNVSAVIEAGRPDSATVRQFWLPSRYWKHDVPLRPGARLRLTMLDTCSLVCSAASAFEPLDKLRDAKEVLKHPPRSAERLAALEQVGARWPPSPDDPLGVNGTLLREYECNNLPPENKPPHHDQLSWLERRLGTQQAGDWSVVVGHSPVFSVGLGHGDYPQLISRVHPLLSRHNAHVYLSGDEHSTQVIRRDGVTYVVAGAGGGLDLHPLQPSPDQRYTQFAKAAHGFVTVHVTAAALDIEVWEVVPIPVGEDFADELVVHADDGRPYFVRIATTVRLQKEGNRRK